MTGGLGHWWPQHWAGQCSTAQLSALKGPETGMADRTGEPFQPSDFVNATWPLHNRPEDKQDRGQGARGPVFWPAAANFNLVALGSLGLRALEMTDIDPNPHALLATATATTFAAR
jgi:hypothetical protein